MRYATPEAFRAALDQRLKNHAAQTGIPLVRLRKTIAFDRFLARLVAVASDRWVLKGALALDFRLGSGTRTTKDIDLGRLDNEAAATDDFLAAQALDLGDFFTFTVQRTPALDAAGDFSAVRYRVHAELAGRRFEEFPIDVAFSDPLAWRPDRLAGTDLLGFAGIERIELSVLPIEQHVAEKLHAYTRAYGNEAGPSTRPKDLVDIVLIKQSTTLDGGALRAALRATFASRGLQPLPSAVPAPPDAWLIPYARLAEAVGLSIDLDAGYREAAKLLDPVLGGHARGTWNPLARSWSKPRSPAPARPRLIASPVEEIVIGELENVASDIQPIRVRTLHVPIANAGDGRAIIHHAAASSPSHGPLTTRSPRTIEADTSSTLELTLAAPVDQTIAPGDWFDIELHYRGDADEEQRLSFRTVYDGASWRIEGDAGTPSQ